eukprot:CAMPEP_0181301268 /NCGR_PEP_ID=MMETSP1101-20121128/7330_1 /TAXON_ID=46948 /ORGANISM="Rhodomonas abbreviata, Strain Caron Lab Isolate" /LENGTH=219 /DNA_ID=CAMNT_0023406555 /DNA_START=225 /DNA_END=881 /DNA_ORIENTATION=+
MRQREILGGCMLLLLPLFRTMVVEEKTSSRAGGTDEQQLDLLLAEMGKLREQNQISFETFVTLNLQIRQTKADHARERREEARERREEAREQREDVRLALEEARLALDQSRLALDQSRHQREESREQKEEKDVDLLLTKLDAEDPIPMALLPLIALLFVMGGIFQCCTASKAERDAAQLRMGAIIGLFVVMVYIASNTKGNAALVALTLGTIFSAAVQW